MISFLDIGTKGGSSLRWCGEKFGTDPIEGVGIDIRERFFPSATKRGYRVAKMDALHLGFKDKSFRFCIMSEFLEHMPTALEAVTAVGEAKRVTREFIYIINPNFRYERYLSGLGLKFSWSTWKCHTLKLDKGLLFSIVRNHFSYGTVWVLETTPILDSSHREIVPLTAPYDAIH